MWSGGCDDEGFDIDEVAMVEAVAIAVGAKKKGGAQRREGEGGYVMTTSALTTTKALLLPVAVFLLLVVVIEGGLGGPRPCLHGFLRGRHALPATP